MRVLDRVASETEDRVQASEGQGVGECGYRARVRQFAGLVDDDVEVQGGVNGARAEGEGQAAVVEGERGDEGFNGGGRAERMTVEALGAGDGDVRGSGAEEVVDGSGLHRVVGGRRGSVGVDIADLFDEGLDGTGLVGGVESGGGIFKGA